VDDLPSALDSIRRPVLEFSRSDFADVFFEWAALFMLTLLSESSPSSGIVSVGQGIFGEVGFWVISSAGLDSVVSVEFSVLISLIPTSENELGLSSELALWVTLEFELSLSSSDPVESLLLPSEFSLSVWYETNVDERENAARDPGMSETDIPSFEASLPMVSETDLTVVGHNALSVASEDAVSVESVLRLSAFSDSMPSFISAKRLSVAWEDVVFVESVLKLPSSSDSLPSFASAKGLFVAPEDALSAESVLRLSDLQESRPSATLDKRRSVESYTVPTFEPMSLSSLLLLVVIGNSIDILTVSDTGVSPVAETKVFAVSEFADSESLMSLAGESEIDCGAASETGMTEGTELDEALDTQLLRVALEEIGLCFMFLSSGSVLSTVLPGTSEHKPVLTVKTGLSVIFESGISVVLGSRPDDCFESGQSAILDLGPSVIFETEILDTSDCGLSATTDTGLPAISDTGLLDTSDLGLAAISEPGLSDTSETGRLDTSDLGLAAISETGLSATSETRESAISDLGLAAISEPEVLDTSEVGLSVISETGLPTVLDTGLSTISPAGISEFTATLGTGLADLWETGLSAFSETGVSVVLVAGLSAMSRTGVSALLHTGLSNASQIRLTAVCNTELLLSSDEL
jgi:hypothetical protein